MGGRSPLPPRSLPPPPPPRGRRGAAAALLAVSAAAAAAAAAVAATATALVVAGPSPPHSFRASAALQAVGRQQAADVTPTTTGVYTLDDAARALSSTPRTVAITTFSVDWGRGEWRVAPANLRMDSVACTADAPDGNLHAVFERTYDLVTSVETKPVYPHPSCASAWVPQGYLRCGAFVWRQGKGEAFLTVGGGRTLIMPGGQAYTNLAFGGRAPVPGAAVATGGVYTHDAGSGAPAGVPRTIAITALSVDGGREEWSVPPAEVRDDGAVCATDAPDGMLLGVFRGKWDSTVRPQDQSNCPHPSHTMARTVGGAFRCGVFVGAGQIGLFVHAGGRRTLVMRGGQAYTYLARGGGSGGGGGAGGGNPPPVPRSAAIPSKCQVEQRATERRGMQITHIKKFKKRREPNRIAPVDKGLTPTHA